MVALPLVFKVVFPIFTDVDRPRFDTLTLTPLPRLMDFRILNPMAKPPCSHQRFYRHIHQTVPIALRAPGRFGFSI